MGKQQVRFLLVAFFFLVFNGLKAGPLDHWQLLSTNTYTNIRTTPSGGFDLLNGYDEAFGTGRWTFVYPDWTFPDPDPDFTYVEQGHTNVGSILGITTAPTVPYSHGIGPTTNALAAVAFGNGVCVAATKTRSITEPNFYVCPTTNTFTWDWTNSVYTTSLPWQPVVLGLPDISYLSPGYYPPERSFYLSYGNGIFVAAGGSIFDGIWTSTNGLNWSQHSAPYEYYTSIAYGNGVFVAGGIEGGIVTSTNGTSWVVTYGSAGENWINYNYLGGQVCYGNGFFVATPGNGRGADIIVSTNGFDWSRQTVLTNGYFDVIGYGNGTFVVSGSSTWQSDHFKNSSFNNLIRTTNGISFALGVETTVPYKVQISSNLIDWIDWTSFTNVSGNTKTVVDTNLTQVPRFYRTVAP